jgi:hypothetical protein
VFWVGIALAAATLTWTAILGTVVFKLIVAGLVGSGFLLGFWLTRAGFPRTTSLIVASLVVLSTPPFFFIQRAGPLFWGTLGLFVIALVVLGMGLGNVGRLLGPDAEDD